MMAPYAWQYSGVLGQDAAAPCSACGYTLEYNESGRRVLAAKPRRDDVLCYLCFILFDELHTFTHTSPYADELLEASWNEIKRLSAAAPGRGFEEVWTVKLAALVNRTLGRAPSYWRTR